MLKIATVCTEVWVDIKGYEGLYQISSLGQVKSLGRFRHNQWKVTKRWVPDTILSTQLTFDGYVSLKLSKDGKSIRHRVHRLVAIAFIKNPFNKQQVNHINCIKTDNKVENLEWSTQSENQIHASLNGLKQLKLNSEDVIAIRNDKRTLAEVAKDYDIAFQTVSEIKNRKIWNWLK